MRIKNIAQVALLITWFAGFSTLGQQLEAINYPFGLLVKGIAVGVPFVYAAFWIMVVSNNE